MTKTYYDQVYKELLSHLKDQDIDPTKQYFYVNPYIKDEKSDLTLKGTKLEHLKKIAISLNLHIKIDDISIIDIDDLLVWLDAAQEGTYLKLPEGLIFTGYTLTDKLDLLDIFMKCPCSEYFINEVCTNPPVELTNYHWNILYKYQRLSEKFLMDNWENINWIYICNNQNLSSNFIRENIDNIEFINLGSCNKIPDDIIEEYKDKLNWDNVYFYYDKDIDFFNKYNSYIKWEELIRNYQPSLEILDTFFDKFNIDNLISLRELSEKILIKHKDKFSIYNWYHIFRHQKLSEKFLIDFEDKWVNQKINMDKKYIQAPNGVLSDIVSRCQKLSPSFIDKYANNLNWGIMVYTQQLTPELIDKYSNKFTTVVNWNDLYHFQRCLKPDHENFSMEIFDKYIEKLPKRVDCRYHPTFTRANLTD